MESRKEDCYPMNVQQDINEGWQITDIDDGYQRVKKLSETVFHYRCELDGSTHAEIIDIEEIDQEDAVSGFYDSVEEVNELYGDSANMIIAECQFEHNCLGVELMTTSQKATDIASFGYGIYTLPNGKYAIADPADGPDGYYLEMESFSALVDEAYEYLKTG